MVVLCRTTPEIVPSAARSVAFTCVALGAPDVTFPNPSMLTESTCDSRSARENVTVYVDGTRRPVTCQPPAGADDCVTVCAVTAPSVTVTTTPLGSPPGHADLPAEARLVLTEQHRDAGELLGGRSA